MAIGSTQIKGQDIEVDVRSCDLCGHAQVCAALRAIAPLFGSWAQGDPAAIEGKSHAPFEVEQMAEICRYFINGSLIEVLYGEGGSQL